MIKKFSIEGMTCAVCAQGIERNVKSLDGVLSAEVSLLAKELTVDFDDGKVSEERIIATVEKLGYTVLLGDDKEKDVYSEAKKLKKRFIISLILLFPLMYFSMGHMFGAPVFSKKVNFVIEFIFALSIIAVNFRFYINGVRALIHLTPNMDTLVSLGSFSALLYGIIVTAGLYLGLLDPTHTFFESSAMVLALVTLGKWLEEISKVKTGNAIEKLNKLIPKTATIVKDGKQTVVLTSEIEIGDVVVLKAGEYVAIDGVVIEGNASIDKSAITGESMPQEISINDKITSGSILQNGCLLVKAEKVREDSLFSKVIEIVKKAGASKAPIQKIADRVAGVFVPIVTTIAILTFIVWMIVSNDVYTSINFAISVLVISCPCALGLATPVAVMATMGVAAKEGVLFKNAEAMQKACKISCVLLDKTATITVGKPKVTGFENLSVFDDRVVFKIASGLEKKSSHPLAKSVIEYCKDLDCDVDCFEYVIGKGIVGEINGKTYYFGNLELVPEELRFLVEDRLDDERYQGKTLLYLATDEDLLAIFAVSDYVKEDSADAIKELNEQGILTVMITGDNKATASRIAKEVGITEYEHEVLPQEKYEIVNRYKEKGYFVAMVGDGINDSPALKSADVGVAIGTGTDIAIDSSDVVLANGSLKGITKTLKISKKSLRIIKQNLFWAFIYNVVAIPVAAGGLSALGVVLTPMIASMCMCLSSLFVVTNALRISRNKKKRIKKGKTITSYFLVDGMMCKHCQSKVYDALKNLSGVIEVDVDLENKKATLTHDGSVANETVIDVIVNVGYTARTIN